MTLNGIAPPGPVPSTICDGRPQPRSIKSRIAPHTTALPQAEPVTVHAVAGPARTTGESSLLPIFSISLEPSFSHGPTLANGRHIGFGGDHWDFSASFPQRYGRIFTGTIFARFLHVHFQDFRRARFDERSRAYDCWA